MNTHNNAILGWSEQHNSWLVEFIVTSEDVTSAGNFDYTAPEYRGEAMFGCLLDATIAMRDWIQNNILHPSVQ